MRTSLLGFILDRQRSSHRVYRKEGYARSVVLPQYREISVSLIQSILTTVGLDRDAFLRILEDC
ncbi:type II toxin-antitoxin system HicA family toxin [bacterium]|nr:type II toxin-antitoxin system HicA family toxin [bacterium]